MALAKQVSFEGLDAVELCTRNLRLVTVTAWGPRIAFLGKPDGDNLLLWKPGTYTRGAWDLRGGHRVWMTRPGADECEDTYATDNAPCEVELLPNGFRITGGENPVNRTRRGLCVTRINDHTLSIDNFVTNTGDMLYSGGVWALTCSVPSASTTYGVPVGDASEWDAFTYVLFRRWAGHGAGGFDDPQFEIKPEVLAIRPRGKENKRMIQAPHGIIAMSDPLRRVTFAKRAPLEPTRTYPLATNLAVYIGPDNFMVEMETMGPEQTLRPGATAHHIETWVLHDGALPIDKARPLIDLFV